METFRIAVDAEDICGECPVWDADAATLYWTDCAGLRLHRYDPGAGRHEIVIEGVEINGFRQNSAGGFVITNNTGIWLLDGLGRLQLIAADAEGARCRMNDCIADPAGRLLAGSWFYEPGQSYEPGKLIQVDLDGAARVLDDGFHLPNGLGFSPAGDILYFADSAARRIYRYDYDSASGSVSNRSILVQVPASDGLPDGLAVDAGGHLWSAQWYGSRVVCYDAQGAELRRFATPAKQTSSLAFGGPDLGDLFVTTAARSEPMPIMPPGYDAESGFFGGPLYCGRVGFKGKKEFKAEII